VRNYGNPELSLRTHINSDTPQGIYYVWGSVVGRKKAYLPRVDLDAASTPINGHKYNINSYTLSQIVPDDALDDYWINEWPLAYSLGRVNLRIASSAHEEQEMQKETDSALAPTNGCLNAGKNQKNLLDILIAAGVLDKDDIFKTDDSEASKLWMVSPKIGRAFLILKDR